MSIKNIEGNYKKTYEGDYTKSYGDARSQKKLYEERAKSYKQLTQTLNLYHKKEKEKYDGLETNGQKSELLPEGGTYKKRIKRTEKPQQNTTPKPKEIPAQPIIPKAETSTASTKTPPPYNPEKITIKPDKNRPRNYDTYRSMVIPPVVSIGNSMYREMINKEVVNESEARKILDYAGYKPKKPSNTVVFYLIALVLGIAFKIVGPIIIIVWGGLTKIKTNTTHSKQMGTMNLSISMPATKEEKEKNLKLGSLQMNIGIGLGILQFLYYSGLIV